MTKGREHEAKSHRGTKQKTRHEQVREAHVEEKVESEPADLLNNPEGINQAPALREATSHTQPRALTAEPDAEVQEEIRVRAFEIFEQRGREDGHELDDWLRAEAELTTQRWRVLAA